MRIFPVATRKGFRTPAIPKAVRRIMFFNQERQRKSEMYPVRTPITASDGTQYIVHEDGSWRKVKTASKDIEP